MIYLVDANVLSEPTKQAANNRVVAWLEANESNIIVDSIIIGNCESASCSTARPKPLEASVEGLALEHEALETLLT